MSHYTYVIQIKVAGKNAALFGQFFDLIQGKSLVSGPGRDAVSKRLQSIPVIWLNDYPAIRKSCYRGPIRMIERNHQIPVAGQLFHKICVHRSNGEGSYNYLKRIRY